MTKILSRHMKCGVVTKLPYTESDVKIASYAFKAIAHPIRLKILCILGKQEMSVQNIVHIVGTSQSNISQHLAILRNKKILASRRMSNRVLYSVSDERILRLIALMQEVFCK